VPTLPTGSPRPTERHVLAHDRSWLDARRRHRRQGRIAIAAALAIMVIGPAVVAYSAAGFLAATDRVKARESDAFSESLGSGERTPAPESFMFVRNVVLAPEDAPGAEPFALASEDDATEVARLPWGVFALAIAPATFTVILMFFLGRSRARVQILAERLGRDLEASEARARAVMAGVVEAIVTTDVAGVIETANPAAEALFGWNLSELIGMPVGDVLPGLALGGVGEPASAGTRERTVEAHRKDGATLSVDVSVAPITVGDRATFILIARDATVRTVHEDQLMHRATHDPLTGLASRNLFEELLVRAVFRGERSRSPVAVLFADLDGFRDVNDAFGHQAGDRVLAETGRRLESAVRPGDLVARLGDDEFAVICESLGSNSDAERIAERIVETVCRAVPVASGVASVTVSIGIAVATLGENAPSLLERAERAMYAMKREGKAGYRSAGLTTD